MTTTIEKRKLVDFALEAGKRYLSPQTDLIHYCYEDENSTDTIPLFENLCYCLTLFRTFIGDHVQEGKERLRHLLSYRLEDGRFPVYLHQYPKRCGSFRTMYPLFLIDKYFHKVIEEPLRSDIRKNLNLPLPPIEITNSKEAGMMALHLACQGFSLDVLAPFWDFDRQLYVGPLGDERQRKGEIETTLFDLFMGSSPRILKPHPIHLHASLVFSQEEGKERFNVSRAIPQPVGKGFHIYRKVWKEGGHLHTLVCQDKNIIQEENVFTYPEEIPDEKSRMELSFYTDRAEEKTILINGKKGTTFKLGDTLSVITPDKTLNFSFKLLEGEGDFLGHLSFGNRPSQLEVHGFTAYDWKIGMRSLRRTAKVKLLLQEL